MNLPLNLRQLLKHAEASRDAAAWEALARNLMAEKSPASARPKARKAKSARAPKMRGVEDQYLTLTERRALGLPPAKDGRIGAGEYVTVLVEFADGVKMLAGQYPRAKDPANRTAAIIGARARYLRLKSDGMRIHPKARIPKVARVTELAPDQVEAWRDRCHAIRSALQAFLFAPHWDGETPRNIDWVNRANFAAPSSALQNALREHGSKPNWWRAEYRGEGT